MIELFSDISQTTKDFAKLTWEAALQMTPDNATKLLNSTTEAFEKEGLVDDADFLRFYFNLQMEMMKE